jgi:polar amino acid transport system substrate-binding protein
MPPRIVAGVVVLGAALAAAPLAARTLEEVKARGVLSMCANPDALPHSSRQAEPPGFQIEIGRALAAGLGVPLQVEWIIPRLRAGLVDCDLLIDTIAAEGVARGPLKISHPYQRSGVALAYRGGREAVRGFGDIPRGWRVGIMVNSLAAKVLDERGVRIVPYSFEQDMMEDLAKGEIDACAVSPATGDYFIAQHPAANLRSVAAYESEPELRWELAVGLRRSDDALVDAINVTLDRLVQDGTLKAIYAKYGVGYRRP